MPIHPKVQLPENSENSDFRDTMRHVSELLLNTATFRTSEQLCVVLVDDRQHLMEIKQIWVIIRQLIIFLGDWHTLANFKPVLVKIYYHSGLRELA